MESRKKLVSLIIGFTLIACGVTYLLLRPERPTFENRNMAQWLRILSKDPNNSESPLRIVQIIRYDGPETYAAEVPISYDLIKQHDFCERNGKLDLIINGRQFSTSCWLGTNGNCLLPFDKSRLNPGTNQIQVYFFINNPSDIDHFLHSEGPVTQLISTNSFR